MMGSGKMTRLMDLENIPILTGRSMRGIGSMISNMGREEKNGQMEPTTKVATNSARSMDLESSCGPTNPHMKETS